MPALAIFQEVVCSLTGIENEWEAYYLALAWYHNDQKILSAVLDGMYSAPNTIFPRAQC